MAVSVQLMAWRRSSAKMWAVCKPSDQGEEPSFARGCASILEIGQISLFLSETGAKPVHNVVEWKLVFDDRKNKRFHRSRQVGVFAERHDLISAPNHKQVGPE
ncbi:MAG: hypothetical protein MI824_02775 [Hyphomicrobiales bacterium]|nr:hypothetical protein [Hyphomicrobiales bacterium]